MTNISASTRFDKLLSELSSRRQRVYDYLFASEYAQKFAPQHLHDAAFSYLKMGGKSLRPAVLLLSCAAVGGKEETAIPAAAGIEVYHTWTLVHDDIIDRDDRRRGAPTVHVEFAQRGAQAFGLQGGEAEHYGHVIGILAGDVQQSWSYMLFHELHTKHGIDPALVLKLVGELATNVQLTLVEGELLDVQYAKREVVALSEGLVVEMLRKKTGILYEFAGRAGATIGLHDASMKDPKIGYVGEFCSRCGTAFQLQDDILGVIGSEAKTGKPVGADIREGKKTLIVYHALLNANEAQKRELLSIIGNVNATSDQVARATDLLRELGGIEYTQQIATRMVDEGLQLLGLLPASPYRDLLQDWAEYLIDRPL
ncbi:MAG: polyprenyl synthetase family protein [Anaerolineae bacterium]|nr:polyprenyl synthetase family protein [Anaerolineae bacterium]